MPADDLKNGLHVAVDGVEYRLVSMFGWSLWSPSPAPGFTKRPGKTGYFRVNGVGENLRCFSIVHRGSYRGIAIDVGPSTNGRVAVHSSDPRAGGAGFTQRGRAEWIRLVDRSDTHLRFETVRTPVSAPWLR